MVRRLQPVHRSLTVRLKGDGMIHMAALSAFLQGISMEGLAKLRVVMVVWMATNNFLIPSSRQAHRPVLPNSPKAGLVT